MSPSLWPPEPHPARTAVSVAAHAQSPSVRILPVVHLRPSMRPSRVDRHRSRFNTGCYRQFSANTPTRPRPSPPRTMNPPGPTIGPTTAGHSVAQTIRPKPAQPARDCAAAEVSHPARLRSGLHTADRCAQYERPPGEVCAMVPDANAQARRSRADTLDRQRLGGHRSGVRAAGPPVNRPASVGHHDSLFVLDPVGPARQRLPIGSFRGLKNVSGQYVRGTIRMPRAWHHILVP